MIWGGRWTSSRFSPYREIDALAGSGIVAPVPRLATVRLATCRGWPGLSAGRLRHRVAVGAEHA